MPKSKKTQSGDAQRHDPLQKQLHEDYILQTYGRVSQPGRRRTRDLDSQVQEHEVTLDSKTSTKILSLAKEQQEELSDEDLSHTPAQSLPQTRQKTTHHSDEESSDSDPQETYDDDKYLEEMDAQDLNTLDVLLPPNPRDRRTLADLIFSKLDAQDTIESDPSSQQQPTAEDPAAGLDPRIVETFTKIGQYLHKYRSGPLPKVFKILPTHQHWARILALTSPQDWSPHAVCKATKLFVSSLKPEQARVFLEGVLLPAVRDSIREDGKLNVHLYEALKKSVFKASSFFKGVVFPLCETGCTLKEAWIIGSVITKMRLPMLHCAAALHRIASMDYSGANSLFIRLLLDKKYALPYKVLDALFEHFVRLSNTYRGSKSKGESTHLPVLWHQSLLVFCQRYANDLTQDQKNALLDVVKVTTHESITPEIRRELVQSVARGEPAPDEDVMMAS